MSTARVDIKVVLLGKEYGGKTSLVERFLHDRFAESIAYQNTIGAAFGAKKVMINGEPVTLGVWDTAGSERYQAMSRMYYRGAVAAIICVNLTEAESFLRAKYWVDELQSCEGDSCRLFLVGTKCDLVTQDKSLRKVEANVLQSYGQEVGAFVIETSAKTGQNVGKLFDKIAKDCHPKAGAPANTLTNNIALHTKETETSSKPGGSRCCGGGGGDSK